jgi:hypothetical protein
MIKDVTEHNFVNVLEYAYKNKFFTQKELCDALSITDEDFKWHVGNDHIAHYDRNQISGEKQWTMSYEAFLNYLEYIELKEARASAEQAKNMSMWAIAISAFLAIFSIVISIYQINTSSITLIERKQVEGLSKRMDGISDQVAMNAKVEQQATTHTDFDHQDKRIVNLE